MMSLGCWGSERRSHHGQDVRFAKADGLKSYLSVLIIPKSEAWRSGLSEYTLHPAACFSRGLGIPCFSPTRLHPCWVLWL